MFNINPYFFGEKDFRTVRESVALRRRAIPINKTLSVLSTVEDLVNITTLDRPALNVVLNPLMNGDAGDTPARWVAIGGATAEIISTKVTRNGVEYTPGLAGRSVELTKPATGQTFTGIYQDIVAPEPARYAISVRVCGDTDTTGSLNYELGVVVQNSNSDIRTGLDDYYSVAFMTPDSTNVWQTVTLIHDVPQNVGNLRIWVGLIGDNILRGAGVGQTDITLSLEDSVFIDAVQMEPDWGVLTGSVSSNEIYTHAPSFTKFVDPYNERYSRFLKDVPTDTDFNTRSLRELQMQEMMHVHLTAEAAINPGVGDVLIDFDRDVSQDGEHFLLKEGETFCKDILVRERISFVNPKSQIDLPHLRGYVLGQ